METREAIRVLQQKKERPLDLEIRSLHLAGNLLELCLKDSSESLKDNIKKNYGNAMGWATRLLHEGLAWEKMQEIIKAQGGNPNIDSEDLKPGGHGLNIIAKKSGTVRKIHSKNLTILCKILGAPKEKKAGIYLSKKIGDKVEKGDILYTLYSPSSGAVKEAKDSTAHFPAILYY